MARMSGKISGKKKEMTGERNGKQRRFMQYLQERTAVLTGDYSNTYVRVLERISQYENESYRISMQKLPTF